MNRKSSDLFKKKKSIHVQLDTDTHTLFRREMFTHGLTMQEAFEAFAQDVATNDYRARQMVERFVKDKLLKEIKELKAPISKKDPPKFGELDSEKLYNLINEANDSSLEDGDSEG